MVWVDEKGVEWNQNLVRPKEVMRTKTFRGMLFRFYDEKKRLHFEIKVGSIPIWFPGHEIPDINPDDFREKPLNRTAPVDWETGEYVINNHKVSYLSFTHSVCKSCSI